MLILLWHALLWQVQGTQWTLAGGALLTGTTADVGPCATLPPAAAFACARGPGLHGVRSVLEVGDKHKVLYMVLLPSLWCPWASRASRGSLTPKSL